LRAAIVTRIFEKSLSIAESAKRAFSSGQITVHAFHLDDAIVVTNECVHKQNIMAVDTPRVQNLVVSFHELWSLPVQIGIALWLLWQQVGITLLAGISRYHAQICLTFACCWILLGS
jgi:ATP-binding cassette subfamily C (CFTR/MRP) protein 10